MNNLNGDRGLADSAAETAAEAKTSADEATRNIQSGARAFGDSIARNSSDLADKANAKFKDVVDSAEPIVSAARDRTGSMRDALVEEIKARPLQAVLVAGLAGVVVGVLSSR